MIRQINMIKAKAVLISKTDSQKKGKMIISLAPILVPQLRMCVINIVHIQVKLTDVKIRFFKP